MDKLNRRVVLLAFIWFGSGVLLVLSKVLGWYNPDVLEKAVWWGFGLLVLLCEFIAEFASELIRYFGSVRDLYPDRSEEYLEEISAKLDKLTDRLDELIVQNYTNPESRTE